MRTIYKHQLNLTSKQSVSMPEGANVLCVLDQHGTLCLWAEVDTDNTTESRVFHIIGTGHPLPQNMNYIGSVVQGVYVWHVYEQKVN